MSDKFQFVEHMHGAKTDTFCSFLPMFRHLFTSLRHHYRSKKIRPRKQEKTGDFERFLPFFRAFFFSKFHRSIFAISLSRKERTMDWTVFPKYTFKNKRPKGLEPTTRFQILSVFCFRHKLFTNHPLQNQSIPSSKGSEPTKPWKTQFSKTVHCSIRRIWTHEHQILTCWRQRKSHGS